MKTDHLIAILSTNVEAVDQRQLMRTLVGAVALGAMIALGAAQIILGSRTGMWSGEVIAAVFAKLVFAAMVTVVAFFYLIRLARPGEHWRGWMALVALPFVGTAALAAISLAHAPAPHWQMMLTDDESLECLLSIPLIAIGPFAPMIWAVRQAAATNLRRAGALAGFVAGGMGAAGYALHCSADSLPFVAVWYSVAISLCALAGAVFGPRLLRW